MLIEYIQNKYETISIVGMAKNAGKTVTLNALIDEAYDNGICMGLTSIGRDGEKQDIVTFTEKPMIYAYENMIIATSVGLFEVSEAKMEVLEMTDFYTSMGKIVIGKVIVPGYVQIAGPCSNADILLTCKKMKEYGASIVLVDGAIDRKSTASPSITEATILSTGAVLSRNMQKAIEQTVYQVRLFHLSEIAEPSIRAIADTAIRGQRITLVGESIKTLDNKTALSAGYDIAVAMDENTQYLIVPGSLVTRTVMDIMKVNGHYKHTCIIIKDATRVFIDYKDWIYFEKMGVEIRVLNKIKLIAVTMNPSSPEGYYFEPQVYKEQLQFYLGDLPVIDVMEA